jgi:DNA (cytosine-5)-methyltransferase 1
MKVTENIFPLEWRLTDELVVPYHGKTVFGTFVCGGGSSMGYKLAGYNHLGGVEFIQQYADVYKANHKPEYFFFEDMRDFNKREDLPRELYRLDLLDGSPPCAGFSTAGARERLWNKESNYESKTQVKDDLVFVYCDTIEKLMPKVFLLENVSGLAKGNAKAYLKKVVNRLNKNYKVQIFLLNAASMGVPQIRPRLFVIGLRKDFSLDKLVLDFDCDAVGFDVTRKYWNTHTDEKRFIKEGTRDFEFYDEIKAGENHHKRFGRRKVDPSKPSFTVMQKDSVTCGHLWHHEQKRGLNIEEIRLLCTFPKDYDFRDTNAISTMGRSVVPVMMANISNQIYQQWLLKI